MKVKEELASKLCYVVTSSIKIAFITSHQKVVNQN